MNQQNAHFIALEGIDSEILSDHAELLAQSFRKQTIVVTTHEPSDGPLGAQLRLIQNDRLELHELPKAALSAVDRIDHLYKDGGIISDVKQGKIIISVNYLLADYVQSNENITLDWLKRINQLCIWPDIVIFIDIPIESVLTNIVKEKGFDSKSIEKYKVELTQSRVQYLKTIEALKKENKPIFVVGMGNYDECRSILSKNLGLEKR